MIKVWDIKTAAKELHVCRETLWRMIRAGKMPHRRVGKRILLTEADVAALLEDAAIRNGATNPFARKNRPKKQKVADNPTEKQSENTTENQNQKAELRHPEGRGHDGRHIVDELKQYPSHHRIEIGRAHV